MFARSLGQRALLLAFFGHVAVVRCDENITGKWLEIERNLRDTVREQSNSLLGDTLSDITQLDLTPKCLGSLMHVYRETRDLDLQVFRLLDSSGRLAAGFVQGTMTDFGNFQECLATQVHNHGAVSFKGQYCMAELMLPLPPRPKNHRTPVVDPKSFQRGSMFEHFANHSALLYSLAFRHGLCVPSTCSEREVRAVYSKLTEQISMNGTISYCYEEQRQDKWQPSSTITIAVLSAVSFIPIAVFVYKTAFLVLTGNGAVISPTLDSLSLDTSLGKVFSVAKSAAGHHSNDNELKFVHGFRVVSLLWIIVSHSYAYLDMNSLANAVYIESALKSWAFQAIANGWLIVDSFFCLSGFLLTFHTIRHKTVAWSSIPLKIVLRYWRLIPLALAALSFQFLFDLLFTGPLMPILSHPMTASCRNTWWHILVGVYDVNDVSACLPHLWYVAVDLKLFIIQVPLSMLLVKYSRTGLFLHLLSIVTSIAYAGVTSYASGLPPIIPLIEDRRLAIDVGRLVYFDTRTHLASYAIGSLAAYGVDLFARKNCPKIPMLFVNVIWLVSLSAGGAAMLIARLWLVVETTPHEIYGALYAGLQRPVWSLMIGWILFACCTGHADLTNRILSIPQMIPLSRLSYAIYLVHAFLLYANIYAVQERKEATHMAILRDACSVFGFSTLIAIIMTSCLEAPIIFVQRILLKKISASQSRRRRAICTNTEIPIVRVRHR